MHARSALFTLFGDVVRPSGGEAWLTTLTACMAALGFSPAATRTALHRMAAEGWVEPRRAGRYAAYRLTTKGVDRLEEAAARIYRLRAAEWDGRWRVLVCQSAGRDPAAERELRWVGFGAVSADTWVSPHPHGERLADVLARRDLAGLRFVSARAEDDAEVVRRAWDLPALRARHAAFLARWRDARVPAEPEASFATRVRLVHDWRSFLFLDPGLPSALLPADWLGGQAASCFRDHYEALAGPSWRYYEQLTAAAPGAHGRHVARRRDDSPFARGLHALSGGRP